MLRSQATCTIELSVLTVRTFMNVPVAHRFTVSFIHRGWQAIGEADTKGVSLLVRLLLRNRNVSSERDNSVGFKLRSYLNIKKKLKLIHFCLY